MTKKELQSALDIENAILEGLNESSKNGLAYVWFSAAWDMSRIRINAIHHAAALRGWKLDG